MRKHFDTEEGFAIQFWQLFLRRNEELEERSCWLQFMLMDTSHFVTTTLEIQYFGAHHLPETSVIAALIRSSESVLVISDVRRKGVRD